MRCLLHRFAVPVALASATRSNQHTLQPEEMKNSKLSIARVVNAEVHRRTRMPEVGQLLFAVPIRACAFLFAICRWPCYLLFAICHLPPYLRCAICNLPFAICIPNCRLPFALPFSICHSPFTIYLPNRYLSSFICPLPS